MEGGLFNSGVLGADFLWWIGQIADDSTWRDNIMRGKFKSKDTIPGWGRRYKVRIIGIHDQGETAIPSQDLPWANVMYPITAGGGQTNAFQTSLLRQGNVVFGFWMDGQNMQVPVIMGVLGNNAQTALGFKIGDNSVTNTQPGSLATSGYAEGEIPPPGSAKPRVPAEGLSTERPVKSEVAKESAPLAPGTKTDQYGLPTSRPTNQSQLNDIASAKAEADSNNITGEARTTFIKEKVSEGISNRAAAANSPTTDPEPGPTIENSDAVHLVAAGDVQREDKYQEKVVLLKPGHIVESATKGMQTEIDNLSQKVDKFLGSQRNYIDAVSGPLSQESLLKEVKVTAQKCAKYQKIIMDKIQEYQNKKINSELAATVAELPSSLRSAFGDQKFLNTEQNLKAYGDITKKLSGQLEGILGDSLGVTKILGLVKKASAEASSGLLWANSTSQSAAQRVLDLSEEGGEEISVNVDSNIRVPKVPICYAEDVVAKAIAANRSAITGITSSMHKNYDRFLNDMKSELEEEERKMQLDAYDKTNLGKVVEISDEEIGDITRGGTLYYTEDGAPCSGGSGTGLKVNVKVSTGGLYDNGSDFITIDDEGAGYTVNAANSGSTTGTGTTTAATTTGGSGSGIKVNYTIAGGKVTGITSFAPGSSYKDGDVLTVVNNASGTPSTNATFTVNRLRGLVDRVADGGITINDPGTGYKAGDELIVVQSGSGGDCQFVILQVTDPGEKKATAGPVTPNDTTGSVADATPQIGQKIGQMLSQLPNMVGNISEALDFENLKTNIFPFEDAPNMAVSDFYTLARGGAGHPETEVPSAQAIAKSIPDGVSIPDIPDIPFAEPGKNQPSIDLLKGAISQASGFSEDEVLAKVQEAKEQVKDALDQYG